MRCSITGWVKGREIVDLSSLKAVVAVREAVNLYYRHPKILVTVLWPFSLHELKKECKL